MIRQLTQVDLENQEIVIYKSDNGRVGLNVKLFGETLWLSINQIANLFERDKSVISKHLKNIFNTKELDYNSTIAKFATVKLEGTRSVVREIEYYNLDAIISIGYKVNSKKGTEFRKWSSQILKDYLLKGYTLNQERLNKKSILELKQTIDLLSKIMVNQDLVNEIGIGALDIIQKYSKTWGTLLRYDKGELETYKTKTCETETALLSYNEAIEVILLLKKELLMRNEAGELFGQENNNYLMAILNSLDQTFDCSPLYGSVQEKAANLLYFIIKDHPFNDGNKRIGCLLFLIYLKKYGINLQALRNNTLIALALLIAESDPSQKVTMIQLTICLLED